MTTRGDLDADALRRVMLEYRDALRSHQDAVNRLNVYPVPDGDTGTNMALTLEAVVAELEGAQGMATVCRAIAHGSLMGARGNSGVILSQILRGLTDVLARSERAGPAEVATALVAAASAAYDAVMRPVEGTILTVARESATGAEGAAAAGKALVDVLDAAKAHGEEALERTPELLPVLAEAGVVDAGGSGFLLLLDAALAVVAARPLPVPVAPAGGVEVRLAPGDHDGGDLRFEVMYLLEAPDEAIPAFRDVWAGIGDSIVVVGGDGLWNCHIHTDDVGAAIEVALDAGRPRSIRVTDLHEQVEEERWVREAAAEGEMDAEPPHVHEPVTTAVVAVGTGPGIRRIFYSLGVQQIVAGGQSMNPSTAQLLDAVAAAPADAVVILPNNTNIVPVAEQVAELSSKAVRVVPTTGIAEGFAALIDYDPEAAVDANADAMRDAAHRVVAGEVTQAVRASSSELGPIAEGDWIGLSRQGIEAIGTRLAPTACDLLDRLVGDSHEIVTIIEGEGASVADTRRITEWLGEHRPDVTPEVHHGGQPLYPYLFGVE